MGRIDGQLQGAQLEEAADAAPSLTPRSRIYADSTSTSKVIPKIYNGTRWSKFITDSLVSENISSTANVAATSDVVFFDGTSAAFTATLFSAASYQGRTIFLKRTDNTFANLVTVDADGAQTIDGVADITLATLNESWTLFSNGSNWIVLDHFIPEVWVAYTPANGAWTSNVTYTGFWRRVGDSLDLDIQIALTGAPTSANCTVVLPTGLVIDTAKMTSSGADDTPIRGYGTILDSGTDKYMCFATYNTTTTLAIKKDDGDGTYAPVTQAAPITFATGDRVRINVGGIPIVGWRG